MGQPLPCKKWKKLSGSQLCEARVFVYQQGENSCNSEFLPVSRLTHCRQPCTLLQTPHASRPRMAYKPPPQEMQDECPSGRCERACQPAHLHAKHLPVELGSCSSVGNLEHEMQSSPSSHFSTLQRPCQGQSAFIITRVGLTISTLMLTILILLCIKSKNEDGQKHKSSIIE